MRRLVVPILAGACGRIGFDGAADSGSPNAELEPFGAIAIVSELSSPQHDDDPTLTGDLLEIYFSSSRTGEEDIYRSVRSAIGDPWSPPAPVTELNSPDSDGSPEITPDGLTLFLGSRRVGGSDFDVYLATRPAPDQPWTTPVRVAELCSSGVDLSTAPATDLLSLVMHSDRGADEDVYLASRESPADPWSPPQLVTEVSGVGADRNPFARTNNTVIYFASSRAGGTGGLDLWRATRPDVTVPFSPPLPLIELNTAADEEDPWLSPDGRTLYFSREIGNQKEVFSASR